MNKGQFKGRSKQTKENQVKDSVKDINGKVFRDKLLEKKVRALKAGGRTQSGYGDFKDDIPGYSDLDDDIRGYGDFTDDIQRNG